MQSKAKKPLVLPLRASYGNAIADYILHERPESDSDYVFLRTAAPFGQLGTGSIYGILKKLEERAGIKKEGRATGSRRIYISGDLEGYLSDYDRQISFLFPDRLTFFQTGMMLHTAPAVWNRISCVSGMPLFQRRRTPE